jgi:hypothetical protein
MEVSVQLANATLEAHGLLGLVFDWIKTHAWDNGDLPDLTRADLHSMADNVGVTEPELIRILPLTNDNPTTLPAAPPMAPVLPRAADNAILLDRMMEARQLDPGQVRRSLAALVREMELVCTRCKATGLCRDNLLAGRAGEHFHEYCANAESLDELRAPGSKT